MTLGETGSGQVGAYQGVHQRYASFERLFRRFTRSRGSQEDITVYDTLPRGGRIGEGIEMTKGDVPPPDIRPIFRSGDPTIGPLSTMAVSSSNECVVPCIVRISCPNA